MAARRRQRQRQPLQQALHHVARMCLRLLALQPRGRALSGHQTQVQAGAAQRRQMLHKRQPLQMLLLLW